jgi:hypothetical protein
MASSRVRSLTLCSSCQNLKNVRIEKLHTKLTNGRTGEMKMPSFWNVQTEACQTPNPKIMDIIVCIKQVPETTQVQINPETNTLIREGVKSIINPFDMYAIEEAVLLKEKCGGKATVISMGPPQAKEALREVIAIGVDKAILLSDPAFEGSDTLATSYILSKTIAKLGEFDIVIDDHFCRKVHSPRGYARLSEEEEQLAVDQEDLDAKRKVYIRVRGLLTKRKGNGDYRGFHNRTRT